MDAQIVTAVDSRVQAELLGNPYRKTLRRFRKGDYLRCLRDAGVEHIPTSTEGIGWSMQMFTGDIVQNYPGLLHVLPKLFFVESLIWIERELVPAMTSESLGHKEKLVQISQDLFDAGMEQKLPEEEAKIAIDLACRHWLVSANMSSIVGASSVADDLRSQLWEACFGRELRFDCHYEKLLAGRNVVLLGETGTGKELAAQVILSSLAGRWNESKGSRSRVFPPVEEANLAVYPSELVAAQIVGYKRGAFTGADKNFQGVLSRVNGGGAFLDEIGDLSPHAQVALLRVLETGKLLPLGGTKEEESRCRIVSATHVHIEAKEDFRKDLFYRLAGVVIRVPPLRERMDDLAKIADYFREQWGDALSREDMLEWCASAEVQNYHWPGNVREFRRALVNKFLGCQWKPPSEKKSIPGEPPSPHDFGEKDPWHGFPDRIRLNQASHDEVELWYVQRVLASCKNNYTQAAGILGVSRQRLARMVKGL